jgi:hypothetical protein
MNTATLQEEQKRLSDEVFHGAIAQFKAYQKDPDNRPKKDPDYGHKIEGNLTHEHYIFYALLRGKDPAKTSHDPSGESFKGKMDALVRRGFPYGKVAFGLSPEDVRMVLSRIR